MTFDYSLDFNRIDFRKHPELYRVGNRQEVSSLLKLTKKAKFYHTGDLRHRRWLACLRTRFTKCFLEYKAQENFVGMDMARKFLQMGY